MSLLIVLILEEIGEGGIPVLEEFQSVKKWWEEIRYLVYVTRWRPRMLPLPSPLLLENFIAAFALDECEVSSPPLLLVLLL